VGEITADNAVYRLSISPSIPKIFVLKVHARMHKHSGNVMPPANTLAKAQKNQHSSMSPLTTVNCCWDDPPPSETDSVYSVSNWPTK